MNIFPWRKNGVSLKEANNKRNEYKNFIVKAIGLIASQGSDRQNFTEPEYNLDEIKAAANADSYIKMALLKYSCLIYKAGYQLKSDNDDAVKYIKTRFKIMSLATGKPMDILFQEIADDLIKYSNAFLVKSRVDKIMNGIQARGIFNNPKPVGGYFRIDPTSIRIKRDQNGRVLQYEQRTDDGRTQTFAPTEVIHYYMDREADNAFGTPRISAALEDVKLLRRIEGNVVSLIYRFAIPIYQWIIGLPEAGFQATDKEIKEAQREIENMAPDGVIVTNEKTQIKAIGAEGNALDASNYLLYFEKRVFSALNVSEAQMGRGGAKQDADSMEAQVHDTVKYIQRIVSIFNENYIINELLLEGGFDPIANEEDVVDYSFNEINLDTKVKVENHEMLKYQSNLNTFEEARRAVGKKTETIDENRLYANMIDNKNAIDQINAKTEGSLKIAQLNAAKQAAAGGNAGNGNTKKAAGSTSKATTNNNRPQNQHGTTSAKIKEDDDSISGISITESLEVEEKSKKIQKHKKNYAGLYNKYEMLRNDITEGNSDLDLLLPVTKDSLMTEIKVLIQIKSNEGIQSAVNELNKMKHEYILYPHVNMNLEQFYDEADTTVKELLEDIGKRVKLAGDDKSTISSIFSALEYRLRFLLEYILPKVYWYSFVKTGAYYNVDKAYIKFNGSDDKEEHPSEINPKSFNIDDIPAYHSYCDCKVSFKAGDK